MRLTKLSVENYKSIRQLIELPNIGTSNALIGPNNEGKSSVIEALYLLSNLMNPQWPNSPQQHMLERLPDKSIGNLFAVGLELELESIDPYFADEFGPIVVKIMWGGQVPGCDPARMYPTSFVGKFKDGSQFDIVNANLENGNTEFVVSDDTLDVIMAQHGITAAVSMRQDQFLQRFAQHDSVTFLNLFGDWVKRLVFVPSTRDIEVIGELKADTRLINSGSLPALLHHMLTNESARFREFETLISSLVPDINHLYVHTEDSEHVSIRVSSVPVENTSQAYRLDTVGTGVKEIIYLMAVIRLSPARSVIIIEEPERGLHAKSQRLMLRNAIEHAKQFSKQMILATHSTILASLSTDGSVHLVSRSEQGTSTSHITDDETMLVREALGQSNVDIYNYDVAVFYDGESERAGLPAIIQELVSPEEYRSMYLEPLKGDIHSRKELLTSLIGSLRSNHAKVFVFADDDNNARTAREDLIRIFGESDLKIHIWDCGIREISGGVRGAEFEDNFSYDELVWAANQLGGEVSLTAGKLGEMVEKSPQTKVSHLLESYFHESGFTGWSKVRLAKELSANAISTIRNKEKPRGRDGNTFEFERVISEDLRSLFDSETD